MDWTVLESTNQWQLSYRLLPCRISPQISSLRQSMDQCDLNSSPYHFQCGSGILNNIGGTYCHNGMMNDPRIPSISWFCWIVKLEGPQQNWNCPRTVDFWITMHWIKEVEITIQLTHLWHRSILGHDFHDFDRFEATMVLALNIFSPRRQISERGWLSKSSVLQNTTDSYWEN